MENPDPRPTVVIGLGNPLMGDDGFGLVALERLRALGPAEVELVDGGTWGLNLLPVIESAGRLLLLDAIDADRRARHADRLTGDDLPRPSTSSSPPHEVDLRDVLALASSGAGSRARWWPWGSSPPGWRCDDGLEPGGRFGHRRAGGAGRDPVGRLGHESGSGVRAVHEMSLALEVCRIAEEQSARPERCGSSRSGVDVGEDMGIEPANFEFCLEALLREPPFSGARAEVRVLPGDDLRLDVRGGGRWRSERLRSGSGSWPGTTSWPLEVRASASGRRDPAFNLVSSPGSGKTALLERTLADLGEELDIAVVTGDVQTQNDADRLAATPRAWSRPW